MDGNDVLAVRAAADEAVERARSGDGPTMLECVTYRLSLHTTADDPTRYRDEEEVERWMERDPIPRFRDHLVRSGILDEDAAEGLAEEIDEELAGVWTAAEKRIGELDGAEAMFDHLYAEMPPTLRAQAGAFVDAGPDRAAADEDEPDLDEPDEDEPDEDEPDADGRDRNEEEADHG